MRAPPCSAAGTWLLVTLQGDELVPCLAGAVDVFSPQPGSRASSRYVNGLWSGGGLLRRRHSPPQAPENFGYFDTDLHAKHVSAHMQRTTIHMDHLPDYTTHAKQERAAPCSNRVLPCTLVMKFDVACAMITLCARSAEDKAMNVMPLPPSHRCKDAPT